MEKLLPKYQVSSKGGRPGVGLRKVANGIFYVLNYFIAGGTGGGVGEVCNTAEPIGRGTTLGS